MRTKTPAAPTPQDVERIIQIDDAVMRNLWITQCYAELSAALASRTGLAANWCTFAIWASKQAGQTIRKEDLERLFELRLAQSQTAMQATADVIAALPAQSAAGGLALQAGNFPSAVERASDAVARGNKKVFEEIGAAFARFLQTCPPDAPLDPQMLTTFCAGLRPGDPPEGQGYLRQAFTHYAQALSEADPQTRAELMLLANMEIGFHEQTRLQPEIAESLDAGLLSFVETVRFFLRRIFPVNGWLHLAHLYLMRLLGRPTVLDLAVRALLAEAQTQLRYAITEVMMTIALPSGVVLRLGEDLALEFPQSLRQITHPELRAFLERYDRSPDSLRDTGALDWADLPERLHFILDLFRCYQEQSDLFQPPFTAEQTAALKAGRLPQGRL